MNNNRTLNEEIVKTFIGRIERVILYGGNLNDAIDRQTLLEARQLYDSPFEEPIIVEKKKCQ